MQKRHNTKNPPLQTAPKETNTPFPGAHVYIQPYGTVKLFVDGYLIVACPYGEWYWESPARNPTHDDVINWFMREYFPNTELRKPSFHLHGFKSIVPTESREGVAAK